MDTNKDEYINCLEAFEPSKCEGLYVKPDYVELYNDFKKYKANYYQRYLSQFKKK